MYWSVVRAAGAASGNRSRSSREELEVALGRAAAQTSTPAATTVARTSSNSSSSSSISSSRRGSIGRQGSGWGGLERQQQQQRQGVYAAGDESDSLRDDPLDDETGEWR
jgi:hypothetical protein